MGRWRYSAGMPRPAAAFVSVAALAHNLAIAARQAAGARVWAVVKANAYGHGLEAALRGFAAADGLALLEFDHALRLREAGWTRPVLMIEGPFDAADVADAAQLGLSLVVHRRQQIDWLAAHDGAPIDVWLKLNTGMNRLGVSPSECGPLHRTLSALPAVRRVGLMTHFADADRPHGIDAPLERFLQATRGLDAPKSVANSAALLANPAARLDWVRPGIMLYGASAVAGRPAAAAGLRAAMSLRSELIGVQSLRAGDTVGYGSGFVAPAPMRIGVVACGYADGYPRVAPTGTPVVVAGVRTRTVGRVSMDMLTVDLGPVPQADVGAPVELWGEALPVDEVAEAAGTLGYELLCALAPRVPLHLVDG
jgi:alanine racemase